MGGVNLIPTPRLLRREEERKARRGLRAVAGYLGVLLLATLAYLATHQPATADAAARELAVAADRTELLERRIADAERTLVETDRRLAGARVLAERPDWSRLLRLVSATAGPDAVLRRVELTTAAMAEQSSATLQIEGVAPDPWAVSALALRLEDTGLFDAVTIEASRREPFRGHPATAFAIRGVIFSDERPEEDG